MSNCSAAFSSTWRKWLERAIGSHRTRDLPVPLLKFNNVLDNYEEQPWGALENLTNVRTEEEGRECTRRQLLWLCSREKRMLVKILSVCASKNKAEFWSSIQIDKFQFILLIISPSYSRRYCAVLTSLLPSSRLSILVSFPHANDSIKNFLLSIVSHEQVEPKAQVDVRLSIRYRLPEENGAIIIHVNRCLYCIPE